MNIRQKLTLGIAAIFMLTLTIVGVTYAYFVTRVTGTPTESVDIKTAEIGSLIYENGNCTKTSGDTCDTNDVVSLINVLPGSTTYKSFRVTNTSTSTNANSQYTIFLESWPTENKAQFVHGSAGAVIADDNTDPQNPVTNVCYNSSAVQSTGNTIAGNVVSGQTPTYACFDAGVYNNVYVTLYEVDSTTYAAVGDNGTLAANTDLGTALYGPVQVVASYDDDSIVTTTATQDLGNAGDKVRVISGGNNTTNTKYYVLKVEYRNINANQNIENDAELNLKVSIK